jgi:hypothetical protein
VLSHDRKTKYALLFSKIFLERVEKKTDFSVGIHVLAFLEWSNNSAIKPKAKANVCMTHVITVHSRKM